MLLPSHRPAASRADRAWSLLTVCAVLLAFDAPAGSVYAQTRVGVIVGEVIDQRTQEPIQDALVSLVGTSHGVSTDTAGKFRVQGVLAGRYVLEVDHLAYGVHRVEVGVESGVPTTMRLLVSRTAIALAPIAVEAFSTRELRARGAGFRRSLVTREQIARAEGTHMALSDVLQAHVPAIRVRRLDRIVGSPTCIEFRSSRVGSPRGCLSPAVYLDGTPVTDPTSLYGTLDLRDIESLEVIPASEAGVRFGPGALYGALLVETRRPGLPMRDVISRRDVFDWSVEPAGHATGRVLLWSTIGNAAGLAIGASAVRQCLHLREPAFDGLVSDCSLIPTLGFAAAALGLPALAGGFGSRLAGRTTRSEGRLAPAIIGGVMMALPGYALVLSGRRNDSDGLRFTGYSLLIAGAPIMSTMADYLFRRLRGTSDPKR